MPMVSVAFSAIIHRVLLPETAYYYIDSRDNFSFVKIAQSGLAAVFDQEFLTR